MLDGGRRRIEKIWTQLSTFIGRILPAPLSAHHHEIRKLKYGYDRVFSFRSISLDVNDSVEITPL
ncbi:uncharacterized protein Dmul_15030 [Desulfococcus multivorans]|nr:uncharacterized protein Dmul_15030 [Desulfococcus multivorans]